MAAILCSLWRWRWRWSGSTTEAMERGDEAGSSHMLEALQREGLKQLCPTLRGLGWCCGVAGRNNEEKGIGMADEEGITDIVVDGDYEPRRREQLAAQMQHSWLKLHACPREKS